MSVSTSHFELLTCRPMPRPAPWSRLPIVACLAELPGLVIAARVAVDKYFGSGP